MAFYLPASTIEADAFLGQMVRLQVAKVAAQIFGGHLECIKGPHHGLPVLEVASKDLVHRGCVGRFRSAASGRELA